MLQKLTLALGLFFSLQASAQTPAVRASVVLPDNFVRISIDSEPETAPKYRRNADPEVSRLKNRVRTLESAVRQLQEEIYYLRYANQQPQQPQVIIQQPIANRFFCSLTSSSAYGRTYTGRGDTETEARAEALKACQGKENSSMWCEDKVRCEEAR